jgi:hypothetical protein
MNPIDLDLNYDFDFDIDDDIIVSSSKGDTQSMSRNVSVLDRLDACSLKETVESTSSESAMFICTPLQHGISPRSRLSDVVSVSNLGEVIQHIQNALNTSSFNQLEGIFNEYFEVDCSILLKANNRTFGRHLIFNHYQVMANKISNFTFQFTMKSEINRLLVTEEAFKGTIQNVNEAEGLWTIFEYARFESNGEKVTSQEKDRFHDSLLVARSNNMPVYFTLKSDFYLIMNEDLSLFTKVLWRDLSLDLFAGNDDNNIFHM